MAIFRVEHSYRPMYVVASTMDAAVRAWRKTYEEMGHAPPHEPSGVQHICDDDEVLVVPGGRKPRAAKVATPKSTVSELAPEIPASLDTPEFYAAWGEYVAHRREIKRLLTPRAASMQLAKLAEWGPARAAAAIKHSIANGWRGIFEAPEAKQGEASKFAPIMPDFRDRD